jgi:ribose/xylose/arabinose/galactoside ABC-type transport system permease subunit
MTAPASPGVESTTTVPLTGQERMRTLVSNYAILLVFGFMLIAGSVVSEDFLSVDNFENILRSVAWTGFAAFGMLFVTTSGGFVDLSIPATMASAGIIALATVPVLGPVGGLVAGVGIGVLIGLFNGILIGVFRTNPVITTLGTQFAALGIAQLFVEGRIVYNESETFASIAQGELIPFVPNVLLILAVVAIVAHLTLSNTVLGRWIYPTGGNYSAARAAGVPVRRVMISVFVICATLTAIGGVLLSSELESARANAGVGMEFNAIAAVAIGGNSIFGGAGTVPRTIMGILIVGVLNNLMILLGVPAESQTVVKGALIVAAVWLDLRLRR